MASTKQNNDFTDDLFGNYPLDQAIEWINSNLDPDDVFDDAALETWAVDNGYTQD